MISAPARDYVLRKLMLPMACLAMGARALWRHWQQWRTPAHPSVVSATKFASHQSLGLLQWLAQEGAASGAAYPPSFTFQIDRGDQSASADLLFTLLCACPGSRNLRFSREALPHAKQIAAPGAAEPAATGPPLQVPSEARERARLFLGQFAHRGPVVALGMGEASGHDEDWMRAMRVVHQAAPQALIVLVSLPQETPRAQLPAYVRVARDVGFTAADGMALTLEADAYVGVLDACGAAALLAQRPAIFASPPATGMDEAALHSLVLEAAAARRAGQAGSPRLTAHRFLKLWERRDLVVALNSSDAPALAEKIRQRFADAVLCVFGSSDLFGGSPAELSTLARCADAYLGTLDDYGRQALQAGRPGVYVQDGERLDHDLCVTKLEELALATGRAPQSRR